MSRYHEPVLVAEAIEYLGPMAGKKYIDCTVGGGGHTHEILKRKGLVLGIDRDPEAINEVKRLHQVGKELILERGNFSNLKKIALSHNFGNVDGILFDLGVSSHQLEKASRGFSFQKKGPLDMRMDREIEVTASDLVNHLDKRRLNEILYDFGQENLSWSIASAIFSARQIRPIKTTEELANIVSEVYRKKRIRTKIHAATKTFQALRIVVNSEILNLQEALGQSIELLKPGGRLAIISFHSLEDGLVKRFFKQKTLKVLTKKPISPGPGEILKNPRARSARLRVAEKIHVTTGF